MAAAAVASAALRSSIRAVGRVGMGLGAMLAAVAFAACTSGGSATASSSAQRELVAAARRTLAEPSFRARTEQVSGQHHSRGVNEYVMPDRSRERVNGSEIITIGRNLWAHLPPVNGTRTDAGVPYTKSTIPAHKGRVANIARPPFLVTAAHATGDVSRSGSRYTLTLPRTHVARPSRFTYRVAHGRVVAATLRGGFRNVSNPASRRFTSREHYFDFGKPITITPPPDDQVRVSPPVPECDEQGNPPQTATGIAQVCVTSRRSRP
jgi:hypothetical protein